MKITRIGLLFLTLCCFQASESKPKKKNVSQAIIVFNNYKKEISVEIEWRQNAAPHEKKTIHQTLKPGRTRIVSPKYYKINSIKAIPSSIVASFTALAIGGAALAIVTFGAGSSVAASAAAMVAWQGRAKPHGNRCYVVKRGKIPKAAGKTGKGIHACKITGYSSEMIYYAYQRIENAIILHNKYMAAKVKSDETTATDPEKATTTVAKAAYDRVVADLTPSEQKYLKNLEPLKTAQKNNADAIAAVNTTKSGYDAAAKKAALPDATEVDQTMAADAKKAYDAALAKQILATDKLAAAKKAADDARPVFEKVRATEKPAPVTEPVDDPLDADEAPETTPTPATNAPAASVALTPKVPQAPAPKTQAPKVQQAPVVQDPTPTEDTEEDTGEVGDDE